MLHPFRLACSVSPLDSLRLHMVLQALNIAILIFFGLHNYCASKASDSIGGGMGGGGGGRGGWVGGCVGGWGCVWGGGGVGGGGHVCAMCVPTPVKVRAACRSLAGAAAPPTPPCRAVAAVTGRKLRGARSSSSPRPAPLRSLAAAADPPILGAPCSLPPLQLLTSPELGTLAASVHNAMALMVMVFVPSTGACLTD